MESHRLKSLNQDSRSRKRFTFATSKQKSKRASADVYRKYKRRIGVTSAATREENVHHNSTTHAHHRPNKRRRSDEESSSSKVQFEQQDIEDEGLESSTLAEELDLAMDRNASEIFRQFYREIWPLVRSLPELIHHAEQVIQIMLQYMLSPEDAPGQKSETIQSGSDLAVRHEVNHATTDIFHLLAVVARDLRHEIHPYVHTRILPRIFSDLLNPPLPSSGKPPIPLDVTIVEAAFRTIAYILRYDSDQLLTETTEKEKGHQPCLESMRQYYGATIASKRELVRRLAAETFAPLIRKLKSESAKRRHVRRVLRALDAAKQPLPTPASQRLNEDAVDGIAHLCFELARGVKGDLHSKGDFVISCVLSSLGSGGGDNGSQSLSCEVASSLFRRLLKTLNTRNSTRLMEEVKSQISSLQKQEKGGSSLSALLRLATEIVSFNDGVAVVSDEGKANVMFVIQRTTESFLASNVEKESEEHVAKLLHASWVAYETDETTTASLEQTLASLLGCGSSCGSESRLFRGFVTQHIFSQLPLELAMRGVGPLLLEASRTVQDDEECIALIHGVACFRGAEPSDAPMNDDTFFPSHASLCNIEENLLLALLERILIPCQDVITEKDAPKLVASAKCAAFIAACPGDRSSFAHRFKKAAQWLCDLIALVPPKLGSARFDLLLSASIEAFAQLSLVALDQSMDKSVSSLTTRVRPVCEKALLRTPSSVTLLKSCATFCRVLARLSQQLCDNSNTVFEAITPNLYDPAHFKRLHTLQILASFPQKPFVTDHADLDLTDDLDEEPSTAPSAGSKKGPVGVCGIVDVMLDAESMPLGLSSERPIVSLLSKIEVLGRSGKLPVVYADAAVAHLLGLLHIKFSPVWGPATKALAVLLTVQGESTWPFVFERLSALMKVCGNQDGQQENKTQETQVDGFNLASHFDALLTWESSGAVCEAPFRKESRAASDMGKVNVFESRGSRDVLLSLWELFVVEPGLITKNSRDMVPLVVRYFQHEYFSNSDPDANEIFADADRDSSRAKPEPRKVDLKKLLAILKAFSMVKGPEQLASHRLLCRIFVGLVGHHDAEVAKAAVECVLRYKPAFLVPHADNVKDTLAKYKLRDAMLALKDDSTNGRILPEHRRKLAPLLARILIGRLSAKSSSKDSPAARRIAVFSFASGFCVNDEELFPFVYLAARRYGKSMAKQVEDFDEDDQAQFRLRLTSVSLDECKVLPASVHEGFLNMLEAVVSQFGHRIVAFVPCFVTIVLSLLELYVLKDNSQSAESTAENVSNGQDRAGRVRSLCQSRLTEMFQKYASKVDFSPFGERIWSSLDRSLEMLPQLARSAEKAPSLLQLLVVLSQSTQLQEMLCSSTRAIEAGVSCLSQSNSFPIVDSTLSLVENLVDITNQIQEGEDKFARSKTVHKLIPTLLRHFELRFEAFGPSTNWKRELSILSKVSDILKNTSGDELNNQKLDSLATLLLPFLQFKSQSSDRDRMHILDVLESIIPNISNASAESLFATVSVLLGPFKSKGGFALMSLREKLGAVLTGLSEQHAGKTREICRVVSSLASTNPKTIDEMDVDKVVTALKELQTGDSPGSWNALHRGAKSRRRLIPVVRTCFHYLYHEDGVVSRASFYALKDLISRAKQMDEAEEEPEVSWHRFLEQSLVPMVRAGIASKDPAARRFFILLTGEVANVCKDVASPHLFGDLSVLISEAEPNLDFFLNMTHLQIHRVCRALSRLRKRVLAETSDVIFCLQSVSGVLLPLVLHPIYESKTKLEEPLALEAIATLGALSRSLPWRKFQDELWTLLTQVGRNKQQERFIIGAICAFLGSFHFDVGDPYAANQEPTSVWNTLDSRIIPKIETLFTKSKIGNSGEKVSVIRPQVILALTALYKKLPKTVLHRKLPRLLTVLCSTLKSRDSNARDSARTTLAKLAVEIGLELLPDVLRELAVTLTEGYQVHVRAAAVHSILIGILELPAGNEQKIDRSVPALMDLIQQDLFGKAQARKDAEFSQVRYVKEAGGSKGLHSLELLAQMISFDQSEINSRPHQASVYLVVSPLLGRMQVENLNSKQIRQLKDCLDRVVQGLSKNQNFSMRAALPLVRATIEPCIKMNTSGVEGAKNGDEFVAKWLPSSQGMSDTTAAALDTKKRLENQQRKVLDGSDAPKLTGSGRSSASFSGITLDTPSANAAVSFALKLLRLALRKDAEDADYKKLNQLVPLLIECVCHSRDSEALLLAMRCLSDMRGMVTDLPAFDSSSEILAPKTLDLLVDSGGNEDLLQASFKMMKFLFEAHKGKPHVEQAGNVPSPALVLNEEQMELLLSFLQESLSKAAQHNPAMDLIKVLVAKQIVSSGMYDLMAVLLKQSVQSHKEKLRQQATTVYIRFLMNYPMSTDRMEKELNQLIVNIQFDGLEGRKSAIAMVASILAKFPEPVVVKHCQFFFVPLTMQLANEESEDGRRAICECLSTLLSRLPSDMLQSLLNYALNWGANSDMRLQRVSLSVLGIFVDSCQIVETADSNFDKVVLLMKEALGTNESSAWELIYFALLLLEKLQAKTSEKAEALTDLWPRVVKCLGGIHPWVGLVALRLLVQHLQFLGPCSFVEEKTVSFLQETGRLFELTQGLCSFLDCEEEEINDTAVPLAIKGLVFSLKASNKYPHLCFAEDRTKGDGESDPDPVRWLMARLSHIAKPKGTKRRQAIFKCFAAFAQDKDSAAYEHLELMLGPLHRAEVEAQNEEETRRASSRAAAVDEGPSEECQMAKDVMHLLEQNCSPQNKFLDAYGAVKRRSQEKKRKRAEESRAEAARDPKAAAHKKDAKQARKKQRRKRQIEERRESRGGKSRRT